MFKDIEYVYCSPKRQETIKGLIYHHMEQEGKSTSLYNMA